MKKTMCVVLLAAFSFAAEPTPLKPEQREEISKAMRLLQASQLQFLMVQQQLDRAKQAVDKHEADYKTAVDAARKASGADAKCEINLDDLAWRCPPVQLTQKK